MMRVVAVLALVLSLAACSSKPAVHEVDKSKSAQANAELGLRYMLQGKHEMAMDKLKRAIDQDPKSATAHHYMAELNRRLEQYDQAEQFFRRASKLAPEDSSIANNFGAFLCSQKKYEEAEKQFQVVLRNPVYSGRAATFENLGVCMRQSGNQARAEEYFRKALQLDPKMATSLLNMAEISFAAGNALSARAYLQRFAEAAAPTPDSLWLGIRVERQLGDKSAVASYGMMLKNNFPEAEQTRLYLNSLKR